MYVCMGRVRMHGSCMYAWVVYVCMYVYIDSACMYVCGMYYNWMFLIQKLSTCT